MRQRPVAVPAPLSSHYLKSGSTSKSHAEDGLWRFQAKWLPVRVKKTRPIEEIEPRFDSIETEKALDANRCGTANEMIRIFADFIRKPVSATGSGLVLQIDAPPASHIPVFSTD